MYDVIIIGGGPAGVSASLYAKRSNLNVLLIHNGISNLDKAVKIDNYYGFKDGISGTQLYNDGLLQAENIGVIVKKEEVTSILFNDNGFSVKTSLNMYNCNSIVIATGNRKVSPNIDGLNKFEGKGVSYCAICDSFFFKNKKVCILGSGEYAIEEANVLSNVTDNVTILTNGENIKVNTKFDVINKAIKKVDGDNKLNKVVFDDDSEIDIDGLFVALGEASAIDFAKSLGIIVDGINIKVNSDMSTNIKGIYACGNITGGLLQVSKAVYEGTLAGLNASKYVKEKINNGK